LRPPDPTIYLPFGAHPCDPRGVFGALVTDAVIEVRRHDGNGGADGETKQVKEDGGVEPTGHRYDDTRRCVRRKELPETLLEAHLQRWKGHPESERRERRVARTPFSPPRRRRPEVRSGRATSVPERARARGRAGRREVAVRF